MSANDQQSSIDLGITEAAKAAAEQLQDVTLEECIDDIDEFMHTLVRYPPAVLAVALRTHLAGLLRAMVEGNVCSHEHARQFVQELELEALGAE
jgi:hypothetical protein